MNTLLSLSVAILAGLLMTRVAKPLKLPSVTAYLVAGVLIGPYCLGRLGISGLGFVTHESVENLSLVSDVALGFIAFAIGNEFRMSQLKKTGKQATVIGILQALNTTFLVDVALLLVCVISKNTLTEIAARACIDIFLHRNRRSIASRITGKPMPPMKIIAQVFRFSSASPR